MFLTYCRATGGMVASNGPLASTAWAVVVGRLGFVRVGRLATTQRRGKGARRVGLRGATRD